MDSQTSHASNNVDSNAQSKAPRHTCTCPRRTWTTSDEVPVGGGSDIGCSNIGSEGPSGVSTSKAQKKRRRSGGNLMEVVVEFSSRMERMMEKSIEKLGFIGSRMGYNHDLSYRRGVVNAELTKLPIQHNDRFVVAEIIGGSVQKIDLFLSLTDDDRALYVIHLLSRNH